MKRLILGVLFLVLSSISSAAVITFDDIDASTGDVSLGSVSPYQGLTWENAFAYTSVPGFPGFNNGIVSLNNGAYSGGEILGSPVIGRLTSTGAFDLISGYFGAGYYDNLDITARGYFNGVPLFTRTVTVNTSVPQLFIFDFNNINDLQLFATTKGSTTDPFGCGASNSTQFTFDNLTITPGTIPTGTRSLQLLYLWGLVQPRCTAPGVFQLLLIPAQFKGEISHDAKILHCRREPLEKFFELGVGVQPGLV